MEVYNLPGDLAGGTFNQDEVIIRHYRSSRNTVKNKIVLNCNMINLLISGTKTVIYPENVLTVAEDELVILSTGNILTSEVISAEQDFSSVLLYFNNEILNRFWIKYELLLTGVHPEAVKQPYLVYHQDAFIQKFVQSLLLLLNAPFALSAELKQLKLEELLLYLWHLDNNKLQLLQIVSKGREDLALKKTVECHIGHVVTVEELAFLCHMSKSTFKRNFSRLYGTTPKQWLLSQKMLLAAELLKSPSELPSGVYYKVGYQSHSSFSGAFRQHFGLKPSEYQARYLNHLM